MNKFYKLYKQFRIMLITFALGLASVWFCHQIRTSVYEEVMYATVVNVAPAFGFPRFAETVRGCGMGYVQGYVTNDGINLTETNMDCVRPKRGDKRIIKTDGERVISKIDKEGDAYYEIYTIENEHCIDSPSLEVGLELERYLKNKR